MKSLIAVLVALTVLATPVLATSVYTQYGMYSGNVDTYIDDTAMASHSKFHAGGDAWGELWANDQSYGMLQTDALVSSTGGGGLTLIAWQNFPNNGYTYGELDAWGTSSAYMNARMQSSPYVFQIERHDSNSHPIVSASGASGNYGLYHKLYTETPTGTMNAQSWISLMGSGSGSFDMNQWHASGESTYGWGGPNNVNVPNPPGYYTPTFTVSATGSGTYDQYGYGANSMNYNGFYMPGGGVATTKASFFGGFSGTPNTWAN